jgi:glycosyltransferase involved in cell wall biosynthesis
MRRIIFLQNIVAPYRIDMFNKLKTIIEKQINNNLSFSVYFMRLTEKGRSWNIDLKGLKFDYYIDNNGFYKNIGMTYHFHFNPKLLYKIMSNSKTEIVLGGSWNDFNVLILCFFKRIKLLKNKLHIWSEANYMTNGASNDNILKKMIRQFVFYSIDGKIFIPGKIARKTFDQWKIYDRHFCFFPNIINTTYYFISEEEESCRYINSKPVLLIVASLNESIKGILNFIKSIGIKKLKSVLLKIAGEGPDRMVIMDYIKQNSLENCIILLGHLTQDEILEEYKKANIFVLPSFSDSNPLSVIEAMHMKLPLLISERCGNSVEALIEKNNGFTFDPYNYQSIRAAFDNIIMYKTEWQQMGNNSYRNALNIFNPDNALINLINSFSTFSI